MIWRASLFLGCGVLVLLGSFVLREQISLAQGDKLWIRAKLEKRSMTVTVFVPVRSAHRAISVELNCEARYERSWRQVEGSAGRAMYVFPYRDLPQGWCEVGAAVYCAPQGDMCDVSRTMVLVPW